MATTEASSGEAAEEAKEGGDDEKAAADGPTSRNDPRLHDIDLIPSPWGERPREDAKRGVITCFNPAPAGLICGGPHMPRVCEPSVPVHCRPDVAAQWEESERNRGIP